MIACNYSEIATEDDGSCIYPAEYYDCNGCINDTDFDGICDELEIIGCTDDGQQLWSVTPGYEACTYNSSATEPCEDVDEDGA